MNPGGEAALAFALNGLRVSLRPQTGILNVPNGAESASLTYTAPTVAWLSNDGTDELVDVAIASCGEDRLDLVEDLAQETNCAVLIAAADRRSALPASLVYHLRNGKLRLMYDGD
jgi:hypothetical protein